LRISELGIRFGAENMAALLKIFGLVRKQRDDRLLFTDEVGQPTLTEQCPLIVAGDHVYVGDINALWLALSAVVDFDATRASPKRLLDGPAVT
jgi:hypothetical protein